MAKNLRPGPKWIPRIIVHSFEPLSFLDTSIISKVFASVRNLRVTTGILPSPEQSSAPAPKITESEGGVPEDPSAAKEPSVPEPSEGSDSESRRYPSRSRHPSNYYGQ